MPHLLKFMIQNFNYEIFNFLLKCGQQRPKQTTQQTNRELNIYNRKQFEQLLPKTC